MCKHLPPGGGRGFFPIDVPSRLWIFLSNFLYRMDLGKGVVFPPEAVVDIAMVISGVLKQWSSEVAPWAAGSFPHRLVICLKLSTACAAVATAL